LHVRGIIDERLPFIYEDELATKARVIIRDFSLRFLPVANENKKMVKEG